MDPEGKPVFIVFEESPPSFITSVGDKFRINAPSNSINMTYQILFRLSDGAVKSEKYY